MMVKNEKQLLFSLTLLMFIFGPFSAATASPKTVEGERIARQLCAGCHIVAEDGKGSDTIPSFPGMANNAAYTENRLRGWLFNPHPPMPAIHLTNDEVDAIIAYIRSLKK
jgi:cytochrome c